MSVRKEEIYFGVKETPGTNADALFFNTHALKALAANGGREAGLMLLFRPSNFHRRAKGWCGSVCVCVCVCVRV